MSTGAGSWGAVVLAGGGARRLGGADKAGLEVGGTSLLDRALAAVAGADEIVVVGPASPTSRPVTFTREDPPGSGPAAALLHGVDTFARPHEVVLALAVDMPLVGAGTVRRLRRALASSGADGAVLADDRRQPLGAAYRCAALLRVAPAHGQREGLSMRALVADLHLVDVPARRDEGADVDTWADLRRIRGRVALSDETGEADEPDPSDP